MEMQISPEEIMEKLVKLQDDVNFLRQSMEYFEDVILTEDDRKALQLSEKEFREGKTFSLEDIEIERRKNA